MVFGLDFEVDLGGQVAGRNTWGGGEPTVFSPGVARFHSNIATMDQSFQTRGYNGPIIPGQERINAAKKTTHDSNIDG